jgi:hypothetical protein
MAFDFPPSPTVGQTYLGPNNIEYTWDGVTWTGTSEAAGVVEAGSANQVLYKNASNVLTGSNQLVFNYSDSLGLGQAPGSYGEISKFTIDATGKSNGIFINFNGSGTDKQIVLNNGMGPVGFIGTNNTALTIGTGSTERVRITSDGNVGIGTTGAASARLDVRAAEGGSSLVLSDNVNSTLIIKHEAPGSLLTYESTGATQQRWVVNGQQVMKLDNPVGSLNLYRELLLRPAEGSTDIPDIIWMGADDTERHRLYELGGNYTKDLWYRKNGGSNGTAPGYEGPVLYGGNFITTYVHFQSTSLFTNPGFTSSFGWDDSQNFIDVYPPAGYSMSNLQSFIPSIGSIHFSGAVNGDDAIRCMVHLLGDRVRVFVQNTEQREAPRVNFLAIWRR